MLEHSCLINTLIQELLMHKNSEKTIRSYFVTDLEIKQLNQHTRVGGKNEMKSTTENLSEISCVKQMSEEA